jgi:predicted TPR repeat methyltransferase
MFTSRVVVVCCLLFLVVATVVPVVQADTVDPDPFKIHEVTAKDFLAMGDTALTQGSTVRAITLYEQGLRLVDRYTYDGGLLTELSLHTNLATTLATEGKNEQAAESYQNALAAYTQATNGKNSIPDPELHKEVTAIAAQAAFFLGQVYQDLGQVRDAVDSYTYANQLDPRHWASAANLGAVLYDSMADHRRALDAYHMAVAILTSKSVEPTDPPPEPRFIMSQLQYRIGLCIIQRDADSQACFRQDDPDAPVDCKELAAHAFSQAVELDPGNAEARHRLASITADATMKRASNVYVKTLFDNYAANFEHSLVNELGYTGYERLRRGFDRAFVGEASLPSFAKVVDAGCGTGLVGAEFRNVSQLLIGVDLSQAILDEAVKARPNLYDQVVVGDVTAVFREMKPISLIIAGDSFIYFGDLDPLFESIHEGLDDGGYAAFTLENVDAETEKTLTETKPDWRWQLTASGRFAHRKEYVLSTGQAHELQLVHYERLDDFRFERGVGVRGHIFVMRKVPNDNEL